MASVALRLDGVSKLYRLGQVGTGTLSHDLNRLLARMLGRPDPCAKIGGVNDRRETGGDYVWALRDVSFEVPQGEILGVIGSNGAGKSTLLKLLSRVTGPTEGTIRTNGRMASLLEVGTGFHPELSGRENIYLNGAILGMTRREITARFDEIVEFSGCAKYIDTPVKRYSSGMYVRLAFAVAAHLETDILIVDEVLAVGDAEFQQKCLGKMQDMSRSGGRTVLFVSHNMASVKRLCTRSILMDCGRVAFCGETPAVIERYLGSATSDERLVTWLDHEAPQNDEIMLRRIAVLDENGRTNSSLLTANPIRIEIDYRLFRDIKALRIAATVTNEEGIDVFCTSDYLFQDASRLRCKGTYTSVCHIPGGLMTSGHYLIQVDFEVPKERQVLRSVTVGFQISELTQNQLGPTFAAKPRGVIHPQLEWEIRSVNAQTERRRGRAESDHRLSLEQTSVE